MKLICQPVTAASGPAAPDPVAADGGGCVNARLAAKPQHILKLDHGQIRHAGPGTAHHAPVVALLGGQPQIADGPLHVLLRGGSHPAQNGVVVVGTGVDHTVLRVAVGQVTGAGVPAVKGPIWTKAAPLKSKT